MNKCTNVVEVSTNVPTFVYSDLVERTLPARSVFGTFEIFSLQLYSRVTGYISVFDRQNRNVTFVTARISHCII